MKAAAMAAVAVPVTAALLIYWFDRVELQDQKMDRARVEMKIDAERFDQRFDASLGAGRIVTIDPADPRAKRIAELEEKLKTSEAAVTTGQANQVNSANDLKAELERQANK